MNPTLDHKLREDALEKHLEDIGSQTMLHEIHYDFFRAGFDACLATTAESIIRLTEEKERMAKGVVVPREVLERVTANLEYIGTHMVHGDSPKPCLICRNVDASLEALAPYLSPPTAALNPNPKEVKSCPDCHQTGHRPGDPCFAPFPTPPAPETDSSTQPPDDEITAAVNADLSNVARIVAGFPDAKMHTSFVRALIAKLTK